MSLLIQYLVKLTISLAAVWLFYQFVLRRLTFYNSNRWYLLAYTLLSFFIPLINISFLLKNDSNDIIQFVPTVHQYTSALEEASQCPAPIWSTQFDKWDFTAFGLMTVAGILSLRFIISYFSFLKIRSKAKLISNEGVNIYQVDQNIIPFSFGNSIFINTDLHSAEELEEIVKHEFVHVRQKHTIDIIWAEMLCIINWYNPFAWLLKRSIRQNLEFIADDKVIQNGINKKEYQYLLLKVIGNKQFSIATQFNFSSLKKRIVMMNKTKSAKRQLGRFLFLLPMLAIILLSFRHSFKKPSSEATFNNSVVTDTIHEINVPNSKGFYIDIKDNNGNCTVVVKDKNKKEIKRVLLTEWNAKADFYEGLYGKILSIQLPTAEQWIEASNPEIKTVIVKGNIATVTLKNGKTEVYTLSIKEEKNAFEERCGFQKVAITDTIPVENSLGDKDFFKRNPNITGLRWDGGPFRVTVNFKNGQKETYNLENKNEVDAFEKKYGKLPQTSGRIKKVATIGNPSTEAEEVSELSEVAVTETKMEKADVAEIVVEGEPLKKAVRTTGGIKEVTVVEKPLTKTIETNPELNEIVVTGKPVRVATTVKTNNANAVKTPIEVTAPTTTIAAIEPVIKGEVDISVTIKKTTKPEELESLINKLKEKGYELKFTDKNYDNGILTELSGTVKYKGNSSTFSFSDFEQATIAVYRDGDDVYFRIYTGKKRTAS